MATANSNSYSFDYYYDVVSGLHGSASYFGRGVCPSNPKRYVYLGNWQPSQASNLPYVQEGKVYRYLYGKVIEQVKLTQRLIETIKSN